MIQTQRLILRPFEAQDASGLFDLNNDPEVLRYTGDVAFENLEAAEEFVRNYTVFADTKMGRWAVLKADSGEFVGWCGLKPHDEGYVDVGFRFLRKEWSKGYATESAIAMLDYGFEELNLNLIVGRVAAENLASVRVLEKLGMQYWKSSECHGLEDALWYKIDKNNWLLYRKKL